VTLLDQIYEVPELKWLGTCNELNGAYAADGYARIKGNPAALLTTYGVGELSAMNGVAGAYAEQAGMIHLVGMTARIRKSIFSIFCTRSINRSLEQKHKMLIHHTMEPNMDHKTYIGMSEPIRKTHTFLWDDSIMASEIDRVIIEGVKSRLPVFIYIPFDIVSVQLDAKRLETPLDTTVTNESSAEDAVVKGVLDLIKTADRPVILADVLTTRHGGRELARELADITQFQSFSTPLSKGIIDETSPHYGGLYNGAVSFDGVAKAVESSDLVLNLGPLLSDSNTGGFSRDIKEENLVFLGHAYCQIKDKKFEGIHFLPVLRRIVEGLKKNPQSYDLPKAKAFEKIQPPILKPSTSGPIAQDYLWQRIGRFLQPNDIVLSESGTAQFGVHSPFPQSP